MSHLPLSLVRPGIFDRLPASESFRAVDKLVNMASAAKASRKSSRLVKNAQVFKTFRRVIEDFVPEAQRYLGILRRSQDFKDKFRDYLVDHGIRYRTTTEFLKRDPSPEEVARYGAVVEKLKPAFYVHDTNPTTIESRLASRAFEIPETEFLNNRIGVLIRRIADHIPWVKSPDYVASVSEYLAKVLRPLTLPAHPYSDEQLLRFLKDFRKRISVLGPPSIQYSVKPQHIPQPLAEAAAAALGHQSYSNAQLQSISEGLSRLYNEIMFGGSWMWNPPFQRPGSNVYAIKPSSNMAMILHELGHVGENSLARLYRNKGSQAVDQVEQISRSDPYWSRMFDAANYPLTIRTVRHMSPEEASIRYEVAANQIAEALINRIRSLNEDIPYIGDPSSYRMLLDRALGSYVEPLHRAVLGSHEPSASDILHYLQFFGSLFKKFGHPFIDQILSAASGWRNRILIPEALARGYTDNTESYLKSLTANALRALNAEPVPTELAGPLAVKPENIANSTVIPLGELYRLRHFLGNLYHHHPELFLGARI